MRATISVDDARKASTFFAKTAGEGGWRVCIIDSADDLGGEAANSILEVLEEPPEKALFLVISHSPGRLLPTIRSRCLHLPLSPLADDEVRSVLATRTQHGDLSDTETDALIALAGGSPGRAMQLVTSVGAKQFIAFESQLARPGGFDLRALINIAESFSRRGSEEEFNIFAGLFANWLGQDAIRAGKSGNYRQADTLAKLHSTFSDSIAATNALNLDRRQTLMQAFLDLEKLRSAS